MTAPTSTSTSTSTLAPAPASTERVELAISGMTCASCAARIEKKLNRLDGVTASVNYAVGTAAVQRAASVTDETLVTTVEHLGYGATLPSTTGSTGTTAPASDRPGETETDGLRHRLLVCLALTVPVVALAMVPPWQFTNWQWLSLVLAAPVVVWGGWRFHRAAAVTLRHGAATMDTLVSIGTLAALGWSLYALFLGDAGAAGMTHGFTPRPVPTMSAVGVARPSAHGQAMTSTATAAVNAADGPDPRRSHATRVSSASASTTGTNTPETRSARRCTAALPFCASATRRAVRASWVSAPTRVARTTSREPTATVAPTTSSPGRTSTGTDSPVTELASTAPMPSTTVPSVAIRSPGRTTNSSPTWSSAIGARCSTPSRRTATSLAPRSSSARSAAPARRLDRASNQRPARTKVVTPAAASR